MNERTDEKDAWGLPINMERIFLISSRCDRWPIEDAVRLMMGLPPQGFGPGEHSPQKERDIAAIIQMAKNCLGESLPAARQSFDSEDELYVRPQDFLAWTKELEIPVAKELAEVMWDREFKGPQKATKKERQPRPETQARIRCQGIASLLWEKNKLMTIKDMCEKEELRTHGIMPVMDHIPNTETIRRWIKNEKPGGGKPGRPSTT